MKNFLILVFLFDDQLSSLLVQNSPRNFEEKLVDSVDVLLTGVDILPESENIKVIRCPGTWE
jgi:hypothetical protein